MNSGGIRRGLHIDDDDESKPAYEYQGTDANRKRGNFEKDLDAMLFGGFGQPPPRRRPASENKPTEQGKPAETPKPAETQKVQPVQPVQPVQSPISIPIKPGQAVTITVPSAGKGLESKPVIKPIQGMKVEVNKSTDSGKNLAMGQPAQTTTTVTINSNAKVVVRETKPIITHNKKQPSILVPSAETDKAPVINNIPIESQPVLPPKRADSPPAQKPTQKAEEKKQSQQQPSQQQQQPSQPQQPSPTVPLQLKKQEEPLFFDVLHPFSAKNLCHKPSALRKLKKVAEDYKFAEENVALTSSIDVVRPFETDRSRQKKLNDFDFKDYEFPACPTSLGDHKGRSSAWKRQNQLAKTVSFGKYVDPNDIHPGLLSSPHFASTLTAIAENEANTKRLIEDQKANSNGFYLIRLFINSVWRYVVVDASLPFLEGEHVGVISAPDAEFELAPALIEKAYAKSFGGYDSFARVQPRDHYLRDLTGAPVKKYAIDNADLSNIIKKAIAGGQVVVAVPNEKIAALGLNPNFSYTVLNHSSAKGSLELRNSFGTLEEKTKVSMKGEGNFELGGAQVKDCISHILVSSLNTAYSTATIQSRHRHGFYSSYHFTIRKDTHGFLTVSQWDQRLFPANSGYQYSPFRLVLHRVEEDGHATFINAAFTPGSRNLDLEVSLSPGSYTAFVSGNWKQGEYAYNLTFYGSERVDFERVYTEKVPNLIGESLESINLEAGRRTELNKNSCQYFHYHPQSNLAILTVQNTTDRSGTVTADLSRVQFDHLLLLTSHNNEENYSNKLGGEIEEYKQVPLTDRRWSVSLEGGQRFTWILATDQSYDEGNPKAWGFS